MLGRGRPATGRGLPHSRGKPPAGRTRSHSKQPGCTAAAETRPPGPVLRLPARGPQSPLCVSARTMARLVTRSRLGFLARLIRGTWCLLFVAGQVGQPARLQPPPHPYPLWSLREAHFSVKLCPEAEPSPELGTGGGGLNLNWVLASSSGSVESSSGQNLAGPCPGFSSAPRSCFQLSGVRGEGKG